MSRVRKVSTLLLLGITLGACAAADDRTRPTLPSYATPTNNNMGWSVRCPLQVVTNPLNRNYEIFQNEDGSPKSYEQFCAEADSSRRTTR